MRDFGCIAQEEAVHAILDDAIGVGDPFVLTQMLRPRRVEESLDDASLVGGILEYAPPIGPVATSFVAELFNGLQTVRSRIWLTRR
jgi:hypothetical protein